MLAPRKRAFTEATQHFLGDQSSSSKLVCSLPTGRMAGLAVKRQQPSTGISQRQQQPAAAKAQRTGVSSTPAGVRSSGHFIPSQLKGR